MRTVIPSTRGILPTSFLFYILVLSYVDSIFATFTISDAFTIKTGTVNGGCDNNLEALGKYWEESLTLVNYALAGIDNYDTDDAAQNNLYTFFGIRVGQGNNGQQAIKSDVRDYFEGVQKFLQGTGGTFKPGKPWLFCDSTWLQLKQASDQAFTSNGDLAVNDQGAPIEIRQTQRFQELRSTFEDDATVFPYWSPDFNDYLLDQGYTGGTFCRPAGNLAATQEETNVQTVTLCPRSFNNQRLLADTTPRLRVGLKQLVPTSGTLLHELFHLVFGKGETPDSAYLISDCVKLPNEKPDDWENNPESYMLYAVAYYFSSQSFNGALFDLSTTKATAARY